MAYAPDKEDTYPKPDKNGGNNGGGNANKLPAFQPGQLNALAAQLSGGFGGGLNAWKRDMRNAYDATSTKPFNFGGGHGGGGNNNGGGNNPGGGGPSQPGGGGFDPSSPRHRMAPMGAQMPMNAQQPAMMPQMGLLSAGPMNAQQQHQQQGLLGDMPSYVLDFIRSRGV